MVELDTALKGYKEPAASRYSGAYDRCAEEPCATPGPDPEDDFLNPRTTTRSWKPTRDEMREELLPKTRFPSVLILAWDQAGFSIISDGNLRRHGPDTEYVRVDAWGAAEIESRWRSGRFEIREDYGRGRRNVETIRFDARSQMLHLERRLDRPGMATVVLVRRYVKQKEAGETE